MPRNGGLSTAEAKRRVLDALSAGDTVANAMRSAGGRAQKTHENWRAADPDYAAAVDRILDQRKQAKNRSIDDDLTTLDFETWRKRFLGQDTYDHQRAWISLLEGKEYTPRRGEVFEPSDPTRIIINVPPFHAKSQTITIEYVTYRICMNPNVRVIVVSKRQDQARKFLYSIKQRLTSNQWSALQAAYAPGGGFKPKGDEGGTWGADRFYVSGIDSGEKDPTVEALGIGGQIYGSRADLIIMDDCIVSTNANEYEKQISWLESEVESRVKDGLILMVGTRLASHDLYGELRNGERYLSGKSPWTYLGQPIVLEYAEDPKDWKTLWPYTSTPMEAGHKPDENGLYKAWDGPTVAKLRDRKPPKVWSLVYMQANVSDNSTFDAQCVLGSVVKRRKPGPLSALAIDHPKAGMEGKHVILSIDPASSGDTFFLLGAIDPSDKKRHILNAWTMTDATITQISARIEQIHAEYKLNELVIEFNAFQKAFVYDERLRDFCRDHSILLKGHYTSKNKLDEEFGVGSVATLFGYTEKVNEGAGRSQHVKGSNIITLPDPDYSAGIKLLIDELIAWSPGIRGKNLRQDGPMALWFFETRAREYLNGSSAGRTPQSYRPSRWSTRGAEKGRAVINIANYMQAVGE